jgi:hypothetical protein
MSDSSFEHLFISVPVMEHCNWDLYEELPEVSVEE